MTDLFGCAGLRVKAIEVEGNDLTEVNTFLDEHERSIIDIQVIGMLYGHYRFVIIYMAVD